MKNETQASLLAKLMKNHIPTKNYELVLPFGRINCDECLNIDINDVLLLKQSDLTFFLLNEDSICAEIQARFITNKIVYEVINTEKKPVLKCDSKKYDILKISFGIFVLPSFSIGEKIELKDISLNNVALMTQKTIAEGTLVSVDSHIAVKIKKVIA